MSKWQLMTEAALLVVLVLLDLAAAGAIVPLFRTLLVLATMLLVGGTVWRGVTLRRTPPITSVATSKHEGGQARPRQAGKPRDDSRRGAEARYGLLVADVDGTLVGPDQAISPRVRAVLARLPLAGVQVALCTGRSPLSAQRFLIELKLRSPQIFFDGALVAAPDGTAEIHCCPADSVELRELLTRCKDHDLPIELYTREGHFVSRSTPESDWHGRIQGVSAQVADLEQLLLEQTVVKAELIAGNDAARGAARSLAEHLAGKLRFSWAKVSGYPEYDLINVVHPTVSKGEALRRLAEWSGIPLSRVLAIGDGPNDIPLLERAGLGVAMGDAPPSVKAAADAVTAGVDEDGLALAIERFLLA